MAFIRFTLLATFLGVLLVQTRSEGEPEADTAFHLSSRTPYDQARGHGITIEPGCDPVALWAFVTPGTTYPSAEEIQRFSRIEELRQHILANHHKWNSGEQSQEFLKALESWKLSFSPSQAGRLTEQGREEVSAFIGRLRAQFPILLSSVLFDKHMFRGVASPGARDTAAAISLGIYNRTLKLDEASDISQFLGTQCPAWIASQRAAENRAQIYSNTELVSSIVQRIGRSLGFNKLNHDLIRDIYRLCTYETAISRNATSPWCSLFSQSDLEAFEYEEDIITYYTGGPGNTNLANKVSCTIMNVILSNLELHDKNHRVTFQLGHPLMLRAVLTVLGAYHSQQPLTSDLNSARSRQWRNSEASPALGNIVFALNSCRAGSKRVLSTSVFVNERKLNAEWCPAPCDLSTFAKPFASITDKSFCTRKYCLE